MKNNSHTHTIYQIHKNFTEINYSYITIIYCSCSKVAIRKQRAQEVYTRANANVSHAACLTRYFSHKSTTDDQRCSRSSSSSSSSSILLTPCKQLRITGIRVAIH